MGWIRDRAFRLREYYEVVGIVTDNQLDEMLCDLDVKIMTIPLPAWLKEIYEDGTGYINRELERAWRRWLKAHILGHRLLHLGDQAVMPPDLRDLQEWQANIFAGWLLLGRTPGLADGLLAFPVALACGADLPLEMVERWWWASGVLALGGRDVVVHAWTHR